MGSLLKKEGWKIVAGVFVLYGLFVMDLDGHSFAGHVARIAQTPESRELGHAMLDKVVHVASGTRRRVMLAFGSD